MVVALVVLVSVLDLVLVSVSDSASFSVSVSVSVLVLVLVEMHEYYLANYERMVGVHDSDLGICIRMVNSILKKWPRLEVSTQA